jgi:hypothetical protein
MKISTEKYDLAVAYRIYPKVAKPAVGLPLSHDKLCLADACLQSFRRALGDLRAKVWVILDGCPNEYRSLFEKYFAPDDLVFVSLQGIGNRATFGLQLDILLRQTDSDFVYLAEDDYFYLPGQFRVMLDFIRQNPDADFVTPFDHRDLYTLQLHNYPAHIRVSEDHHWRTHATTCLTFLTRRQLLLETERVFRTYSRGNRDVCLWLSLTKMWVFRPLRFLHWWFSDRQFANMVGKSWFYGAKQILFGRRYSLWGPLPGIATHMDAQSLGPAVQWQKRLEEVATEDRADIAFSKAT